MYRHDFNANLHVLLDMQMMKAVKQMQEISSKVQVDEGLPPEIKDYCTSMTSHQHNRSGTFSVFSDSPYCICRKNTACIHEYINANL